MPSRSSGCFKCRARKIRCDETRPSCQRCATHGVPCPGYSTERPGELVFRHQTLLTAHRALHHRSAASNQQSRDDARQATRYNHSLTTPGHGEYAGNHQLILDQRHRPTRPYLRVPVLQSPAAHRTRLYNTFLDMYVPSTVLSREKSLQYFQFGYAKALVTLSTTHPAYLHALDALSLVQVGSIYKDRRLLHQAIESYTRSLKSLAHALARPETVRDDGILAAVAALSLCEFFDVIKQHGHGWIGHQRGMQRLIEARGPDSIDSHESRLLYCHTVNGSIATALLERSGPVFSSPEWDAMESKLFPYGGHTESYRIARTLTQLQQRRDHLNPFAPNIIQDINTLLADCYRLDLELHAYYHRFTHPPPPLESVINFPAFAAAVRDRTLTHAYSFLSYTSALLHSQFWIRTYTLRTEMLALHTLRQQLIQASTSLSPSSTLSPDLNVNIEEDALQDLIINLCRCIPFFVDPENATLGHIACFFPLHVAAHHFHAHKTWVWLRWVRNVIHCVFDRGLSMLKNYLPEFPPESTGQVGRVHEQEISGEG